MYIYIYICIYIYIRIYTFYKIDYHHILLATWSLIKVLLVAAFKSKQLICHQSVNQKNETQIDKLKYQNVIIIIVVTFIFCYKARVKEKIKLEK